MSHRHGFTLIELLVVIAIIAILSVVVVLSLNPAELLRQSRDSNRLSDLATLNSALGLYTTDQSGATGFSLGNASSVYVSLPDSSSTCGSWSLPTLPSGYTYACSASTSSRNINSTGWIPVNFSLMSSGAPFGNLPVDPTNQSSTGLYYTYYSNGSQFIVTAVPESQNQKTTFGAKPSIPNYPDVLANGSSLTISPLFSTSGLVGYWNFDEGSGTITNDASGNGNSGSLCSSGTCPGASPPSWTSGKMGNALSFDGSTNYVMLPAAMELTGAQTESFWINPSSWPSGSNRGGVFGGGNPCHVSSNAGIALSYCGSSLAFEIFNSTTGQTIYFPTLPSLSSWSLITVSWDGTAGSSAMKAYVNGVLVQTGAGLTGPLNWSGASFPIGASTGGGPTYYFSGLIDDFRIYNRALSAAEIQAIYDAEK